MPAPKGNRNNPNGRPPRSRALTNLLEKALSHTVEIGPDGQRISGKRLLARLTTQVLTTGRLRFPGDDQDSVVSVKDWIEFCRWAYNHVDGPAPIDVNQNVTGNLDIHIYIPDNGRDSDTDD